MNKEKNTFDYIDVANRVLDIESAAIKNLKGTLNKSFVEACEACGNCKGKIIVMGLGKSGHIADKIAATFASTGTPAFFIHPSEAIHGDLGMIDKEDVVLILSNSGETEEIVSLIPIIKKMGITIIALTGNKKSKLSNEANIHLNVEVKEEACPMNLAPTASTTAALAMGDAIAVALLEKKGFTKEDFAKSHPGGSLGKKLLLSLGDIMHRGDEIPIVYETDKLASGLIEMSEKALGMTAVKNDNNELVGIFTDGDLRRTLENKVDIQNTCMKEVMKKDPYTMSEDTLAYNAVATIQEMKITSLLIVKDKKVIGALNIHDLFRSGVM
ncbi:MAG TPA: KpsF/GutQ family sugar-phosphate isomerase [Gammaproteobacteria bacterium]|nr:KpsF/GutQ family sugar-phosphate isomerase [Gammaproteobacteria bacterium]HIK76645.1 KpsF/GutQ family sugar-phosphate isomerase [Gammaproteobacteria bacterium]